jgi:hypothetical protein
VLELQVVTMMTSKFKVHAKAMPTQLQLENHGSSISGLLFIEIDGFYFPGENWGDLVLPVLGWWIENAMRLMLSELDVKNIVMDGPHEFYLRRAAGSDEVSVSFARNGRTLPEHYVVGYSRMLAAFRGAARSILNELKPMGLDDCGDASTLKTRLEHLIRLEATIKAHGLP